MRAAVLLAIVAALFSKGAFAQSTADKMLQSNVAVFGTIQENGNMKPASRGGGFMLDSRHVVTNLTACCGKTDRGVPTQPVVVVGDKDASTARAAWSNADAEIAILDLKDAFARPVLTIATFKAVEKVQAVYTAQFLDSGESGSTPKISEGKLLGVVKLESSGVQVYKTSASMNKANSGGAPFDACGNVIGINMMVKDGAQYAYVVDPLVAGLRSAGAQAKVTEDPSAEPPKGGGEKETESGRNSEWWGPKGAEWIPVVLLLAAIAMTFRSPKKKVPAAVMHQQPLPEPARYAPAPLAATLAPQITGVMASRPALRGVAGQYPGKSCSPGCGTQYSGAGPEGGEPGFRGGGGQHFETALRGERSWRRTWARPTRPISRRASGWRRGVPGLPSGSRFFIGDLRSQFEVRVE